MPYINEVRFGVIIIDGKKYHQVLMVGDLIEERDVARLNKIYGSTHEIAFWEIEKLFSNKPTLILIGTGWEGALVVRKDLINRARREGIEFYAEITPQIVKYYNAKRQFKEEINALIHTTC
ncbi:MAG: hypothetical protein KBI15_01730 [Candidatus Pacebacteria bacterium]|nr:hypothetical protein [Candidatus Paceibacterota bacterium]